MLSCSGLIFLLQHPELSGTLIHALRGGDNVNKDVCLPLRYASVSISKGFFCVPQEVGMIVGMHLRVVGTFCSIWFLFSNTDSLLREQFLYRLTP